MPCRHGTAAEVRELLGVSLDGQAMGFGGAEDSFALGDREGDSLAEHVDGIGQALGGSRRYHRLAHQIDIAIAVILVFRWQRMGAEQRGDDAHRQCLAQAPCHTQHF